MRGLQPTFYTASFTYHQAILSALEQRPEAAAGHRLRFARSGSGPLAASVRIGRIERTLGMPLLEVYGATETGTITANRTTGERRPGTVGTALDNDIAIMNPDGDLVPAGVAGEVVVRGPTVFAGYEHDPAINQRLFVDDWYRTGDQGTMDADGYVKLLGRIDDIINRGGEKIAPREVDDALLDHPAVAEAVSFPITHPTLHQETRRRRGASSRQQRRRDGAAAISFRAAGAVQGSAPDCRHRRPSQRPDRQAQPQGAGRSFRAGGRCGRGERCKGPTGHGDPEFC